MKKGLALVAMLLAALVMLSGCNLIGYDAELDGAQPVAKVNDTVITKNEWLAYREYLVQYYDQYYLMYFGFSFPVDDETLKLYGEQALEQMIQATVIDEKVVELGLDQYTEEEQAQIDQYATEMMDGYKMMLRFEMYPDVITVEEEQAYLAEATLSEATVSEPIPAATMTNAELDALLTEELASYGITYDYFAEMKGTEIEQTKLREYAVKDVTITDEEVVAEFENRVATQKETFDATPTSYGAYIRSKMAVYYVPEGYRGVKHVLIKFSDEKTAEIDALNATLAAEQGTLTTAQNELDTLTAADTSAYTEEELTAHNDRIAELTAQIETSNTVIADTQAQLDEVTAAAYAEIEPTAMEVIARAQAGEDFDALIAEYGQDPGMTEEPAKSQGYFLCEGMTSYDPAFYTAAMALSAVGDISEEPVASSFGYHILLYAEDLTPGPVELTEEMKTSIHSEMLISAQDAAYNAAVTQWVSEADVKTYPKVME